VATGRLPDPNSAPVTAKGDLYTYSTVPAKLAVGNNGDTLLADSAATTGLRWQGNFAAGKNKIINGDFGIWQRGTSFSNPNGVYTADRFIVNVGTAVPTWTVSQQTFTPGTAPVAGYEGATFIRMAVTSQGSSTEQKLSTRLEDVRLFAGQTVTFSFWAKAASSMSISGVKIGQNFGSGGSSATETSLTMNSSSVGTGWTRYSGTVTVPSISGKTIGTGSYIYPIIEIGAAQGNYTLDTWGWQVEAGSVATAFQTATGTLQGELAACRYYYKRNTPTVALGRLGFGNVTSTTAAEIGFAFPVTMRTAPTALEQSGTAGDYSVRTGATNTTCSAVPAFNTAEPSQAFVNFTVASGLTAANAAIFRNVNTSAYLGWSAEL
jgi:hypothetical protein